MPIASRRCSTGSPRRRDGRRDDRRAHGLLRVAAPVSLTLHRLSGLPARLLKAHPGLTLRLDLDDGRINIVEAGYDVAIRGTSRLEDSSLMARKLLDLPHVVCAAPAYLEAHGEPERPEDLRDHACLTYALSDHADLWPVRPRRGERARARCRAASARRPALAVRDAALAGVGVALLPASMSRRRWRRAPAAPPPRLVASPGLGLRDLSSRRHVAPKAARLSRSSRRGTRSAGRERRRLRPATAAGPSRRPRPSSRPGRGRRRPPA